MSTDTTISDFIDEDDGEIREIVEPPAWDPGTRARRCDNCDAHVSPQLARSIRDDNGRIHACPECATNGEVANGLGAGVETELNTGQPTGYDFGSSGGGRL